MVIHRKVGLLDGEGRKVAMGGGGIQVDHLLGWLLCYLSLNSSVEQLTMNATIADEFDRNWKKKNKNENRGIKLISMQEGIDR